MSEFYSRLDKFQAVFVALQQFTAELGWLFYLRLLTRPRHGVPTLAR